MSKQALTRPVVLAITSDHHCGSTVGLCPREGVELDDDGNMYLPSKAQLWLADCWDDYWETADRLRRELDAELWAELNGDLCEGDHHRTPQIVSRNPDVQGRIMDAVFGVPLALKPEQLFVVRGTETHTGPSGATEEAFARRNKATRHGRGRPFSHWHLRLEVHGKRLDFQHHGRIGQRPWTKLNIVSNMAAQIFYEHAAKGFPHPHLAVRSHFHQHADTHDAHPTRAVQTPAWQVKTAHAHKVVAENLSDVGGIIVVIRPSGQLDIINKLYRPEPAPLWRHG